MITPETLTDEQIRELQSEAAKIVQGSSPYHLVFPKRDRPGVELLYASTYALGENGRFICGYTIEIPSGASRDEYIAEGRRYCAAILNARGEK